MPEEKNRIEDLKNTLYSRNAPDIRSRRKFRFSTQESDLPQDWGEHKSETDEPVNLDQYEKKKGMSFAAKFFISSAIFCIAAIGIGAYIFFNGGNFISGNNIEINISGPISVPGGAPVSFGITVTNRNSVALRTADLEIRFPDGTTDPEDTTKSLETVREVLGDLEPGASVTKNISAVIFGEQNLQKKITASVTYGIAGSNSVFTKESGFDVVVNASPVSMSVSSLEQTISGQPFDMEIKVKSNSANTVKNVIMRATYPFGYSYKSSSPSTSSGDNVWTIGDIPPGGERKVKVRGALVGEDEDVKVFHFTVGARSQSNPSVIGTTFMETEQVLSIEKPFVSLTVAIDGDDGKGDKVGYIGRSQNVIIKWSNNLTETISNVVIVAHLSGTAYDKNNLTAWGGYYRSSTDDVIWDQKTNPELASVQSGASGSLSFSVTPSESQRSYGNLVNPDISISASASGDRTSATNAPLNTGTFARKVKIATSVGLAGRTLRNSGSIQNTGPIPPIAEQKTTYTVRWSANNTSSIVNNAVVTATLPPYVSWTGVVSPKGEDISYDSNKGLVTWNVGNVNVFTSGAEGKREVEFQVSLEPSVDQIGTAPIIVNPATLVGTDSWTKAAVQATQGYITTSFSTDPSYQPGQETVVAKRK